MKVVTITELKDRLSALLDQVRAGETILVLDRDVPVARLVSAAAESPDDLDGRLKRLERKGIIRRGSGEYPDWLLNEPPPRLESDASIVDAVLEERRQGR
jgi:prevent-host-death family protein